METTIKSFPWAAYLWLSQQNLCAEAESQEQMQRQRQWARQQSDGSQSHPPPRFFLKVSEKAKLVISGSSGGDNCLTQITALEQSPRMGNRSKAIGLLCKGELSSFDQLSFWCLLVFTTQNSGGNGIYGKRLILKALENSVSPLKANG